MKSVPNITIDITQDGVADALSDGLIILRYLFGITGAPMINNALGNNPGRTDPAVIATYLDTIKTQLDVDGNGRYDALTDGLLILRYLFGLRDAALISNAVAADATRKTATDITNYLIGLLTPK